MKRAINIIVLLKNTYIFLYSLYYLKSIIKLIKKSMIQIRYSKLQIQY